MTAINSYIGEVRHLLTVTEQSLADLAIADFMDELRAAADDRERITICRRWRDYFREVRREERD